MNVIEMEALAKLIANSPDPETMPGPHLSEKFRAELAFSALANFRKKAKAILEDGKDAP